jgi:hypothetical protein
MRQTIILGPANKTEAAGTHIKILEQARKRGEKHKHTRERFVYVMKLALCVCECVSVQAASTRVIDVFDHAALKLDCVCFGGRQRARYR